MTKQQSAIITHILRTVKATGIARVDMTADDFIAVKDSPKLRKLGQHVIATPSNLAAGRVGIADASTARVCWTASGFKREVGFQYTSEEITKAMKTLVALAAGNVWQLDDMNDKRTAKKDKNATLFLAAYDEQPKNYSKKVRILEAIETIRKRHKVRLGERRAWEYLANRK